VRATGNAARRGAARALSISSASSNTRMRIAFTLSTRLESQFFSLPCVPMMTWSTMRVCLRAARARRLGARPARLQRRALACRRSWQKLPCTVLRL